MKTSIKVFNINWRNHTPFKVPNTEIIARPVKHKEGIQFIAKNYFKIFEDSSRILKLSKTKLIYYELASDYFLFFKKDIPIGFLMGEVMDGEAYYLRSFGLLKQHQGNRFLENFYNQFFKILGYHPVKRICEHVQPNNHQHIHILNKVGFQCSGYNDIPGYGYLLQFTYFLPEK